MDDIYCRVLFCRFPFSHVTRGHRCGTCLQYGHGQIECPEPEMVSELYSKYGADIIPDHKRCMIADCKYSWSHTTNAHHCKYCNERGHSFFECPKRTKKVKCPICREQNEIPIIQKKIYGCENDCIICFENKVDVYFPKCGHISVCNSCCDRLVINNNHIISENTRHTTTLDDLLVKQDDIPEYILEQTKGIFSNLRDKIYTTRHGGMGSTWFLRRDDADSDILGFLMTQDDWGQYGEDTDRRPFMSLFIDDYRLVVS